LEYDETVKTESEFDRFKQFVKRVISVPHSEVKAKLDAEKRQREAKKKKRAKTSPASRVPDVS
jgi:hypothetical protein